MGGKWMRMDTLQSEDNVLPLNSICMQIILNYSNNAGVQEVSCLPEALLRF